MTKSMFVPWIARLKYMNGYQRCGLMNLQIDQGYEWVSEIWYQRVFILLLDEILSNKYATLILINLAIKKASERQESHGIHKVNREKSCDVSTRVKEDDICYISYSFLHFQQLENPLCDSLSYDAPTNTLSVGILIFYDTSTHPVSEVTDERNLWYRFFDPLQCTLSCIKP